MIYPIKLQRYFFWRYAHLLKTYMVIATHNSVLARLAYLEDRF